METSLGASPELVYFNGIDPDTGAYAMPPVSIASLARRVGSYPGGTNIAEFKAEMTRGVVALPGIDLERLDEVGWGIVFHEHATEEVRAALAPLIEQRRQQAGSLCKILEYRNGERVQDWCRRHGVWAGNVDPQLLPFYLLLIGAPTEIPFEFQYLLSVEYAVGRLAFQQAVDYARYAESLIRYEESATIRTKKEIVFWGTRHPGDAATNLSATMLIGPLAHGVASASGTLRQPLHAAVGYAQRLYEANDATKGTLLSIMDAERPPALLFTASHGLILKPGQPRQLAEQGGLLCQNWPGYGVVRGEHYLAAADVPASANVHGMVAFLFACCGAGTPKYDQFLPDLTAPGVGAELAPYPFVAALPQRLLAHPGGGALAVIGHVDRAFGFSIRPPKATGAQILPFRNSLDFILKGSRVGLALMSQFGQRFAALSAQLLSSVSPTAAAGVRRSDVELVQCWLERNDAQNYVLLGDPAARIRTESLVCGPDGKLAAASRGRVSEELRAIPLPFYAGARSSSTEGKMTQEGMLRISDAVRTSFEPIVKALGLARADLLELETVAAVRPGYQVSRAGRREPAIVVEVVPGTKAAALDPAGLARKYGVPFNVLDAAPEQQLAALRRAETVVMFGSGTPPSAFERLLCAGEQFIEFAPPRTGTYLPLDATALPLVDEPMDVIVCASPEAGWSELERFLADTQQRLTIAMYQFTAPHVFRAVYDAVAPAGRTLNLVLHPVPEPPAKFGVKAQEMSEEEIVGELASALGERFTLTWATTVSKERPEGLWASAYHIKVAVRDSRTFWLSSGNWQSSNQPPYQPFGEPADEVPPDFQQLYNRDYHVVITNDRLAEVFETHILRDAELISTAGAVEAFGLPDLFVPEATSEEPIQFAEPPQMFRPLQLSRRVKVQPLLTPDNYAEHTLALIRSATSSLWFQNQYISFRNTGEDFPDFQLLVGALKAKIDEGLDVRIICRDYMKQESVDILVALGFPRDLIRFQPCCHNKTIIVDRRAAMVGSHNWSNEGVSTNRDATLIFFDEEIADYLARIYAYDWEQLARTTLMPAWPRVAQQGEAAPPGYVRVPYTAVLSV